MPAERRTERAVLQSTPRQSATGSIEIELPNGACIRVQGPVDTQVLARVIALVRR